MQIRIVITLLASIFALSLFSQGILLSDQPGEAQSSAILDIRSDEKGLLIPSMTTEERDAIQNPYDGLIIYNITIGHLNVYDSVEDEWQTLEPLRDPPPPPQEIPPLIPAEQTIVLTAAHFGPGSLGSNSFYQAEDLLGNVVYMETFLSYISAPLFLPAGTIVSSMTVYYKDDDLQRDLLFGLTAQLVGTEDPLSFISSHDTGVGPPSAGIRSINLNIGHILLSNRGYAISVAGAESSDLSIQSVIVNYTLPTN